MKKQVTQAVIDANRLNAQKSTGPRTPAGKSWASRNAIRHGLLSRSLVFDGPAEEKDFQAFRSSVFEDCAPVGALQELLADEIVTCLWKLRRAGTLSFRAIREQSQNSRKVLNLFADSTYGFDEPLSAEREKLEAIPWPAMECRELSLVVDGRKKAEKKEALSKSGEQSERIQIQARLSSAGDSLMRYESALKRDLYRAIDRLIALQTME